MISMSGWRNDMKDDIDLIVLHEDPLIEISKDKKQIWIDDHLVKKYCDECNDELCLDRIANGDDECDTCYEKKMERGEV